MVLDLEYKFQIYVIERKPNVRRMNVQTWEKLNALDSSGLKNYKTTLEFKTTTYKQFHNIFL